MTIVHTFTTLNVLLNCYTQIVKRPHILRLKLLLPERNSLVLCMNVWCARVQRIRMIGACSLQSADAAQLYITGSACLGLFSSIMDMSLYSVPSCSTWKWDPFFLRFCSCCFCSDIIFKSRKGPNGSLQRAWDDILPDQILIFCMYVNSLTFVTHIYAQPCLCLLSLFSRIDNWIHQNIFCRKHKLVRKLRTPERNHIIFPEANELRVPNTPEGAPVEQDVPEEIEVHDHQPSSEQTKAPSSATSDQNQCYCSSPLSFAPSSSFTQPYPGSCGWLDDWSYSIQPLCIL